MGNFLLNDRLKPRYGVFTEERVESFAAESVEVMINRAARRHANIQLPDLGPVFVPFVGIGSWIDAVQEVKIINVNFARGYADDGT